MKKLTLLIILFVTGHSFLNANDLETYRSKIKSEIIHEISLVVSRGDFSKREITELVNEDIDVITDWLVNESVNYDICDSVSESDCAQAWKKTYEALQAQTLNFVKIKKTQEQVWLLMMRKNKFIPELFSKWMNMYLVEKFGVENPEFVLKKESSLHMHLTIYFCKIWNMRFPSVTAYKKIQFVAYYNYVAYQLMNVNSCASFETKSNYCDSLIKIAAQIDTGMFYNHCVAQVYCAIASSSGSCQFTYKDHTFNKVEQLYLSALKYERDEKIYYSLGVLYNNFMKQAMREGKMTDPVTIEEGRTISGAYLEKGGYYKNK